MPVRGEGDVADAPGPSAQRRTDRRHERGSPTSLPALATIRLRAAGRAQRAAARIRPRLTSRFETLLSGNR